MKSVEIQTIRDCGCGGGGKEGRCGTVASELVPVPHVSNNMLECGNLELTIGDSP